MKHKDCQNRKKKKKTRRRLHTAGEINVNPTAPCAQRIFFFTPTTAVLGSLFFFLNPQSCDCNVKPLTGKQRRGDPLRRHSERAPLRSRATVQASASPREDEASPPVTNKQRRRGKVHGFQAERSSHRVPPLHPGLGPGPLSRSLAGTAAFIVL